MCKKNHTFLNSRIIWEAVIGLDIYCTNLDNKRYVLKRKPFNLYQGDVGVIPYDLGLFNVTWWYHRGLVRGRGPFFERSGGGNCEAISRPWKDHFKSDLRSDQDHLLKKDLKSDQDHIF
jgi:hypothetical protein